MNIEGLYTDGGHHISTFTNHYIDVRNPKPEDFKIEDIAHQLSRHFRYSGRFEEMFTVAQHSTNCYNDVPRRHQMAALLHDASEAYLGDMSSPAKREMPDYYVIEDRFMRCIAERFGFVWPLDPVVKNADRKQLEFEWSCFAKKDGAMYTLTPNQARKYFLNCFNEIS